MKHKKRVKRFFLYIKKKILIISRHSRSENHVKKLRATRRVIIYVSNYVSGQGPSQEGSFIWGPRIRTPLHKKKTVLNLKHVFSYKRVSSRYRWLDKLGTPPPDNFFGHILGLEPKSPRNFCSKQ